MVFDTNLISAHKVESIIRNYNCCYKVIQMTYFFFENGYSFPWKQQAHFNKYEKLDLSQKCLGQQI